MDNPRAEKVAVVDEVRERLSSSDGALLTEYRGLTVAELATLRRQLAAAGADYKIYKNTLVRLAIAGGPQASIHELLTGPTAISFVQGDVSAVAKTLRDFAKGNPNLVVKGGIVGDGLLSASEITVLADLPPRDTLLAQFACALSAPMQQLAGLLEALPRNLAYGLAALLDQRGAEAGDGASSQAAPAEPENEPTVAAEPTEAVAEAAPEAPVKASAEAATEVVDDAAGETGEAPGGEAGEAPGEEADGETAPAVEG
jgi:large subunit ribosomal protein L10